MSGNVGRRITLTWGGVEIPGVKEKGIQFDGEPIDVSADDSAGWRELISERGQQQVTVNLSGVTKNDRLRADWAAGTISKAVVITYPTGNGGTLSGTFMLANYKDTGPFNDAMTFEAELRSTGAVAYA